MCSITKEIEGSLVYNRDENEIFQDFLNTFESSNDNTNVINAPQEPFVFNQDPDENSSQSPPHINHHCCYGCGDSLDGIFYQQCTCESCGNSAHIGYNCLPKVLIISNPEPCYNQNVDEFPQTLPSLHSACYSRDESLFTYDSNLNFVDDSPNLPPQPPTYSYEFCENNAHYGHDCPPQTFQAWLQQQVVNLDSYTPEPSQYRKIPIYYDDDDDEESSTPLRDIIISKLPSCIAITPVLSTEKPKDSLIMGDEHLDTIPEKESDKFIKSSGKNLVPNPSESEDLSDIERRSEGNLFEPFFDEEIISINIDSHHFNAESDLRESLLNQDSLIISSPKIDSLLEEFFGELAHIDLISPGINEADFDPEEKFVLLRNCDSLMEEIDIFLALDDSIPPDIENDNYDSEGDILFLEELLSNDPIYFLIISHFILMFHHPLVLL
uniref:Reverse transcriptase domain-containing protein n=1 Tax=Tanacetum cinerariifolium TaxID=118510 RepID=A0A6L2K4T4_TANCI|nr:hypothetical protein [Tanacetum cinerariifolium]